MSHRKLFLKFWAICKVRYNMQYDPAYISIYLLHIMSTEILFHSDEINRPFLKNSLYAALYKWYSLHSALIRSVLRRAIYIKLLRNKVQNLMGKDMYRWEWLSSWSVAFHLWLRITLWPGSSSNFHTNRQKFAMHNLVYLSWQKDIRINAWGKLW